MLTRLSIKNYALIKELTLTPCAGLNVVTGETGAGKSIMLGAMELLIGNRADVKMLHDETEKCVVEAEFHIAPYRLGEQFAEWDIDYSDNAVFRREITPAGKSRAFINDTPVTLDALRELGRQLIDIHSQHNHLELSAKNFQRRLVDTYGGHQNLVKEYAELWKKYAAQEIKTRQLKTDAERLKQEADYTNFLLQELEQAQLQDDQELKTLEQAVKLGEHAELIKKNLGASLHHISEGDINLMSLLAAIRQQLQPLSALSPEYKSFMERLESLRLELQDIKIEAQRAEDDIAFDAEKMLAQTERLNLLNRLLHKHKVSDVAALQAIEQSLSKQSRQAANIDDEAQAAEQALQAYYKDLLRLGNQLLVARQKKYEPLARQLSDILQTLGMPNVAIQFEQNELARPTAHGLDDTELLFSANKGIEPKPLGQVASGGEFSRLMFAIKYILAEKTSLPTLLLDEIDTGVSGEIAVQMGQLMQAMSQRHQLIVITHLPQIAAKGATHYYAYKDNTADKTISQIKKLDDDARVQEIAAMISGAALSKNALKHAQELIGR